MLVYIDLNKETLSAISKKSQGSTVLIGGVRHRILIAECAGLIGGVNFLVMNVITRKVAEIRFNHVELIHTAHSTMVRTPGRPVGDLAKISTIKAFLSEWGASCNEVV
ncbi:hypothetical protein NVP1155O_29 [Vibrio phage 1.155.O._10N.222.55.B3]|nr:hypothetical protein NVP1155O_29 [Vibrio phage 1.155.O._10N.222.55.B3]